MKQKENDSIKFRQALDTFPLILTECAISEQLRRRTDIQLHPTLFNTPLLYKEKGRICLRDIYYGYRKIALDAELPILLCAPTWRIDRERVQQSDFSATIIADAIHFISELGREVIDQKSPFFTGALLGPRNDCYRPEEALPRQEAAAYHSWQLEKMADTGKVDVIIAQTMSSVDEAMGICDAMAAFDIDYVISFVINRHAQVLDGTPLKTAIQHIDDRVTKPPTGYMVNCVYPTFLRAADQEPGFFSRLIGIQANSSSKDHDQLDGSAVLQQDSMTDWGAQMLELHTGYGVKILGGCCGTDKNYLNYIANNANNARTA